MTAAVGVGSAEARTNTGREAGGVFPHLLPASGLPLGKWDLRIGASLDLVKRGLLNE